MSGGSFDYAHMKAKIFAEELAYEIQMRPQAFRPETVEKLKMVAAMAHSTSRAMKAAEWLYSGDYGEDDFAKIVDEVLRELE